MTKRERVKAVFAQRVPDQIPVMMHNFLSAAKEAGYTMREYRSSALRIADSLLRAAEKYDLDGVLIDMDTALLASACGALVKYPEDIAAVAEDRQNRTMEELIEYLPHVSLQECDRVQIYLEAASILAEKCHENDLFFRCNADQGPYSLACELTGMNEFLMSLVDEECEETIHALIGETYRICLEMHRLCYATGADCTSYGNSSEGCSVVSPDTFRKFGKPYEVRLAADLKALGIPTMCHICGNVNPILEDLAGTGCPAYELDYKTDIELAQRISAGKFIISGNIDPALMNSGKPEKIRETTRKLAELYNGKGGLIFCSGCALGPLTPEENIRAAVDAIHQYGRTSGLS